MSRLNVVLMGAASLPVFVAAASQNILLILADDLGCNDLGIEGSLFYETPHLDHFALSGARFTQGYAGSSVCSPSRACIMTGKATPRHGITDWIGAKSANDWTDDNNRVMSVEYIHNLPQREITMAEALRDAGYKTFFAGKWHLGSEGSWPEDHGFDVNKGGWKVGHPDGGYFSPWINPRLKNGPDGQPLPFRLADETVQFMDSCKDEPFFVCLSFYAVHGPLQTTKLLWEKYRRKAAARSMDSRLFIDRTLPVRKVQDNPVYAGMVEMLDEAVGRVLAGLEDLGLADNTIVIFTSDNGGASSVSYATSNAPLRGGKGQQWEGGIRDPFYIRVPGMTATGSVSEVPVVHMDIYPTILELAGLPLQPAQHVDGVSLVPLLKGGAIADRDLFWHYPHYGSLGGEPSSIIRSEDWKLIHYYEDGHDELYNLGDDLGEKNDLASTDEHAKILRNKLDAWLADTGALIPQPNPDFDPVERTASLEKICREGLSSAEKQQGSFLDPTWQPDPDWWGSCAVTE